MGDGRGGGKILLLILAVGLVVAVLAWLLLSPRQGVAPIPKVDVPVSAPDVLPDPSPVTPPPPVPTPSG